MLSMILAASLSPAPDVAARPHLFARGGCSGAVARGGCQGAPRGGCSGSIAKTGCQGSYARVSGAGCSGGTAVAPTYVRPATGPVVPLPAPVEPKGRPIAPPVVKEPVEATPYFAAPAGCPAGGCPTGAGYFLDRRPIRSLFRR